MHKDSHNFDDIDNLNEEIYKANEIVPLNDEEKKAFRKQILKLIGVVLLFTTIFLIFNLVLPSFNTKKKKAVEVDVENKVTLANAEDGDISLDNNELLSYNKLIDFSYHPNKVIDLIDLYKAPFKVEDLDKNYQMFFVSRSDEFKAYLQKNEINTCNNLKDISESDLVSLLKKSLNLNLEDYPNFKTVLPFNTKEQFTSLSFSEESYKLSCEALAETIDSSYIKTRITSARKMGDSIYIEQKAIFININGIFSDPAFSLKLHDNPNAEIDKFLTRTNSYTFIFKQSGQRFYLYEKQ